MRSCLLALLISTSTFANDSSYIKFTFADQLPVGKFDIRVNDGIKEHKIKLQNTMYWHGELFAPFGYIEIAYGESDTSLSVRKYFFGKGRLEVSLTTPEASGNIIPYSKMGGDAYDAFKKEKVDSVIAYYNRNKHNFGKDNALVQRAFALADSVFWKEIAFIKQSPDLYISYWSFLTLLHKTTRLSPEKLMEIYNAFPDEFKGTKAADTLTSHIRNKMAIVAHGNFPDFSVTDINNNKIELSKLKGNYVLIQFWASWCRPCIEEMPELKKIHEKYGSSPFKLISFSIDKNLEAGRKAITQHGMNWAQVMEDDRLYHSLAYVPIPQLYLIDKSGRTIYNNTTIHDVDLGLLKKLLAEHLDNPSN